MHSPMARRFSINAFCVTLECPFMNGPMTGGKGIKIGETGATHTYNVVLIDECIRFRWEFQIKCKHFFIVADL